MNAFGIDLNGYNKRFPISKGSIDFLITRIGGTDKDSKIFIDADWQADCQVAQDIDVPCIGYWWVKPKYYLDRQWTMPGITALSNEKHPLMPTILAEIANRNVHGFGFDVEEGTFEGQVTPAWIAFYIRDICERLNRMMLAGTLRKIRLGVYSRKSWMEDLNKQGKDLGTWLGTHPEMFIWPTVWLGGVDHTLPIEQARTLMPTVELKVPTFGWTAGRTPLDWTICQFAGDAAGVLGYKNDKTLGHICLDMFHGDAAAMRSYFYYKSQVVVIPPDNSVTLETVNSKLDALIARWDKVYK